jgi:hypothetical protein
MTEAHPSDMELQHYVQDETDCPPKVVEHFRQCADCQASIAAYRSIFEALNQSLAESFDFDVAALVLSRLPPRVTLIPQTSPSNRLSDGSWLWKYGIVAMIIALITIPVCLLWKNIYYVFAGTSGFLVYVILGVFPLVLLFKIVSLYRSYRRQLGILNYL